MEKFIIGVAVVLVVILGIAIIYGIAGAFFAFMWNWLTPALFKAFGLTSPHLSWMAGVAASWLIGVAQAIFGGFRIVKKD